jgi:hypothetical protein
VFAISRFEEFSVLQSRVHEVWARFMASSMKDDLRYTPTDCFETFPFPIDVERKTAVEEAGRTYYDFRADLMRRQDDGLTTVYNWFHDSECECIDMPRLRELHDLMDRAVLDAYGWNDIPTHCEFVPQFDDEENEDENAHPRRKKYRYRWPDEIRDEVLARLLELNRQRALEEGQLPTEPPVFARMSDAEPKTKGNRKKAGKRASEDLNLSLLPQDKEEA